MLALTQLVVALALLASAAETFRERPWWPHPVRRGPQRPPPRGSAPGQRRWVHAGLAVVLLGNMVSLDLAPDEPASAVVALGLVLTGVVLVVVGLVRRPTPSELARYETDVRGGAEGPRDRD